MAAPAMCLQGLRITRLANAVSSALIVLGRGFAPPVTPTGWVAVLAIALLCTVVAITAFFAGPSRLGAPDASTLPTLEPLATIVLAAVSQAAPNTLTQRSARGHSHAAVGCNTF